MNESLTRNNSQTYSFVSHLLISKVSLTASTASQSGDQHATVAIYFETLEESRGEQSIKQVYNLETSGTPVPDCKKLRERTILFLRYTLCKTNSMELLDAKIVMADFLN